MATIMEIKKSALVQVLYGAMAAFSVIWFGTWVGYYFFIHGPDYVAGGIGGALINWDAKYYVEIAQQGYSYSRGAIGGQNIVFFPLYPIIIGLTEEIPGGAKHFLMIMPAMAAGILSIFMFYWLAKTILTDRAAVFATAAYAFYPGAAFFVSAYPTSLMNLLAISVLLLLKKRMYIISAVIAGIGSAAGPLMIFLSAALFFCFSYQVMIVDKKYNAAKLIKVILIGFLSSSGIIIFMLYQYANYKTPFAFVYGHKAFIGDLTFSQKIYNLVSLKPIIGGNYNPFFDSLVFRQDIASSLAVSAYEIINASTIIVATYATWLLYKHKEYSLLLFSILVISGYLWFQGASQGPISAYRLLYVDIPIFIAAGFSWENHEGRIGHYAVLLCSSLALILQSAFFVSGYWAF